MTTVVRDDQISSDWICSCDYSKLSNFLKNSVNNTFARKQSQSSPNTFTNSIVLKNQFELISRLTMSVKFDIEQETDAEVNNESFFCGFEKPQWTLSYPKVRRDGVTNHYNGTEVPNPYQYLEDSNREDTHMFIQEQNELFHCYISQSASRPLINRALKDVWNYPKINVPIKKGARYFYWENSGMQNQSVLYVKESLAGKGRVLLDPNAFHIDGLYSVENIGIARSGQFVAYALSESGSDWCTIKVRDVDCAHDLDDTSRFAKFSDIVWTTDCKGFFYQRFPIPFEGYGRQSGTEISENLNAKVYYHFLGSLQEDDILVVEFPENPTWTMHIEMSDDGDYLFVHASDVIGEKYLYYARLREGMFDKLTLTLLLKAPGIHWYLANDATILYLVTNVGAANSHVIRMDMQNPGEDKWAVVVPDQAKRIYWAFVVNMDKLIVVYMKDVICRMEIRDLKTGDVINHLPIEVGTVSSKYGRRCDNEFYFMVESYINPGTVYKVEFNDKGEHDISVYKRTSMDLSNFHMDTVSYSSNDGTNIPIFLVHKKDMVRDYNRPCLFTAYGGYGTVKPPLFNPTYLFFAQHFNGVVASANIRGGGEYGKQWWDDGRLLNKQNAFEDFIDGARFLMNNGFTRPQKLAIEGMSNGGLLIGAVVNQRPDICGAAIPQVGIMDMLRYHKFTIGHLWVGEFGSPDDPEYFSYLKKYSPLHNIRIPGNGQYPAILATTADHDDRVVPSHSYKYIAELQHAAASNSQQKNPFLMRVESKAGHGIGKPIGKRIEERTDIFTFLELTLGYEFQE